MNGRNEGVEHVAGQDPQSPGTGVSGREGGMRRVAGQSRPKPTSRRSGLQGGEASHEAKGREHEGAHTQGPIGHFSSAHIEGCRHGQHTATHRYAKYVKWQGWVPTAAGHNMKLTKPHECFKLSRLLAVASEGRCVAAELACP